MRGCSGHRLTKTTNKVLCECKLLTASIIAKSSRLILLCLLFCHQSELSCGGFTAIMATDYVLL